MRFGSLFTHAPRCHSDKLMPFKTRVKSDPDMEKLIHTRPINSYKETLRNIISTKNFSSDLFLQFHGVKPMTNKYSIASSEELHHAHVTMLQ